MGILSGKLWTSMHNLGENKNICMKDSWASCYQTVYVLIKTKYFITLFTALLNQGGFVN